jgi:hypothetical protein
LDSITLGILLGESYYNWHLYACGLFCLAYGLSISFLALLPGIAMLD